jgi:hypothetical protein
MTIFFPGSYLYFYFYVSRAGTSCAGQRVDCSLYLISGKSPPNGLSCSVQVSYTVETLIFLASVPLSLDPLPLRFFLLLFFHRFTIWVPPVIGIACS